LAAAVGLRRYCVVGVGQAPYTGQAMPPRTFATSYMRKVGMMQAGGSHGVVAPRVAVTLSEATNVTCDAVFRCRRCCYVDSAMLLTATTLFAARAGARYERAARRWRR